MLQVRDVTIEAGGLPIAEGISFSLHAGDKVGLVGRNGAGKTSLLQALAGEAQPARGAILRRGRLGYLRQDPRLHHGEPGLTALAHILDGRGLAAGAERVEKLRLVVEESASQRNVARYSRAEEEYRDAGGYAAESEGRRIVAGLGVAPDRVDLPIRVLR